MTYWAVVYGGASNMTGEYNDLKARIKAVNKQAVYIWCHAHRLNLVAADAVSSCTDVVDLFANLESLFSFLYCSKKKSRFIQRKSQDFLFKITITIYETCFNNKMVISCFSLGNSSSNI